MSQTRYLGMLFQSGQSFQPTFHHLEQRMWAAHYFLRKRYQRLGCSYSVWLPLQLHAACVEPAGSFGSEIWGVYQQHARGHQRLEAARLKQIRQLSGLAQSVALPILWRELSLCPFYHAWVIRAACFWNALASTQGFHTQIALDAVMLALHRHVRNWVHGLRHSLSVVGNIMHLDPAAMHNIDISELRICLSAHLARVWNNLAPNPRVCPSAGARLCTYLRWFAQPTNNKADLVRLPLPRKAMVSFLRFRTGCHALPNVIGTRTGVPRSQRLCPLCQAPYSDERHTLLECTALSPLRENYQQLFCPHVSMRQFMWQNDLPQLARFVIECLQFLAAAQATG